MNGKIILFVCTGNICRSPMAEYMLRDRLNADSDWTVRSAGISAAAGIRASEAAIAVLAAEGIDLTLHRSRPLTREWVDAAAVIVVMTAAHVVQLAMLFPDAAGKVFLLKSFGTGGDVRDPIGLTEDAYGRVRDEIDEALPELITFLESLQVN